MDDAPANFSLSLEKDLWGFSRSCVTQSDWLRDFWFTPVVLRISTRTVCKTIFTIIEHAARMLKHWREAQEWQMKAYRRKEPIFAEATRSAVGGVVATFS